VAVGGPLGCGFGGLSVKDLEVGGKKRKGEGSSMTEEVGLSIL